MFKTETHLHVSEVSKCGKLSAKEMVKAYSEAGYKTLFISDHLSLVTFSQLTDATWRDKMDFFVTGYENAKIAGEKFGMNIILSAEIGHVITNNHYLVYGIDREFLYGIEAVFDKEIEEIYRYTHDHGAFLVQAHPLRDGHCTPTPMSVDAFEIYNSNPRHANFSEKVEEIAKEFDLPMTAGSDSHQVCDIALSGIETDFEIKTAQDYYKALMERSLKIIR